MAVAGPTIGKDSAYTCGYGAPRRLAGLTEIGNMVGKTEAASFGGAMPRHANSAATMRRGIAEAMMRRAILVAEPKI